MVNKKGGWYNNPTDPNGRRHGLAARGIKTATDNGAALQKRAMRKHPYEDETGFEGAWLRKFEKEYGKINKVYDDNRGTILETDEGEFLVYENEDEAIAAAEKQVREDLEENPEYFYKDFLNNYLYVTDTDRRIIAQEEADDYVDNVLTDDDVAAEGNYGADIDEVDEQIDEKNNKLADMIEKGQDKVLQEETEAVIARLEEEKEELLEKSREELREQKYDEVYEALEEPEQYFVNEVGAYSREDLLKQPFISIDIDEAAEEAVNIDGAAHFLASYDGEERMLEGKIIYRVN